jgi:hypothetical protein
MTDTFFALSITEYKPNNVMIFNIDEVRAITALHFHAVGYKPSPRGD